MKILALDISSISTGYCIISNGKLLKKTCGIIETDRRKTHSERLNQFSTQLLYILETYNPDEIICEEVFKGRNIKTFKVLCMFRGVALNTIFEKTSKIASSITASEARSLLNINNTKEDTFNFIVDKYKLSDFEFEKHNDITDAIALGLAAHIMHKQGINEKSIRNIRRSKKRNKRRNKKSVSKTSARNSSRQKSK